MLLLQAAFKGKNYKQKCVDINVITVRICISQILNHNHMLVYKEVFNIYYICQ